MKICKFVKWEWGCRGIPAGTRILSISFLHEDEGSDGHKALLLSPHPYHAPALQLLNYSGLFLCQQRTIRGASLLFLMAGMEQLQGDFLARIW